MTKESDLGKALKDSVNSVQSSVTFDRVWQLHPTRSKRPIRSTRKAWMAGIAAMIMFSLMLSPAVRASISNLIDTKIIKNSSQAMVYEGWVSSRKWDTSTTYATLQDAEKALGTKLPFPQQFLSSEAGAINREMSVTTEKGNIVGYYYSLRTKERMLSVTANYKSETDPRFNVESTEAVVNKTVDINGIPTHLIAVKEFDGYWIYMENGDWKIVIQGIAQGTDDGKLPAPHFTEDEAMNIARSVKW
ncbi:hypothetical protein [Paenibacillus sp. MBLB4367]|uniref:hypothetical protein n=1 Tax=Paenibacillus sp. MBLB4367 TaxID=3384767 RepID=UPI0039083FB3